MLVDLRKYSTTYHIKHFSFIQSFTNKKSCNSIDYRIFLFIIMLWSWRVSLEPFYKISQDIKYHVISYLSLSFINLNIS